MIAEVLLPVPLSRLFDYRLTTTAVSGQRVLVEFGKSKHQVGLIVNLRELTSDDEQRQELKDIISVLDDFAVVDEHWHRQISFAARYYAEPLGKAFKNAFPKRLRTAEKLALPRLKYYELSQQGSQVQQHDSLPKAAVKQRLLLDFLHRQQAQVAASTLRCEGFSAAVLKNAVDKGLVNVNQHSPYRENSPVRAPEYALNTEQQQVIDAISQSLNGFHAHLLYGVTGSGKTEVYMQLIKQMLEQDRQVLLMMPEIALTPQMLSRFSSRFGCRVAAYHSGLSDALRRDIFLSAQAGELPILLGTRSSIFIPLPRLGLILIDEEHDLSYKQQEGFLYHARDLAIWRARTQNVNVVLGSATPSLESLENVKRRRLSLHTLSTRATQATLPTIHLVDRRGNGREQVLSDSVQQKMRRVLHAGKQVLLFLNRRGFAPVMLCGACGWRSSCPDCSVSLTAHLGRRQLCCHHCGHNEALPLRCPDCQSRDIYFAGAGTEKLEAQLQQQFPRHNILRLDRDKQPTAKQLDTALARIHNAEVDIILGTQLVVKGHHFPGVEMVCVVDADSALFSSDFRAEERLYQQLIQVAGRAGRESTAGNVYIQSVVPDHAIFHALLHHDYLAYAERLLGERRDAALPPYTAYTLVKASAKQQPQLLDFLRSVKQTLNTHAAELQISGPMPSPVEKIKNRYQAQLWLSAADKAQLQKYLPLLQQVLSHFDPTHSFKSIIDVDSM